MTQFFQLSAMFSNPTGLMPNNEHQKVISFFVSIHI